MTTQPDQDPGPQGPPRWFFPALLGGMLLIAGLVAALLTMRPPVAQAPAAQAPAPPVPTLAPPADAPA